MPKAPAISTAFEWLGALGQFAHTSSALLAIGLVGWYAWRAFARGSRLIAAALLTLIGLSLIFLVIAPNGWLAVGYHVLAITALMGIVFEAGAIGTGWRHRIAWGFPAASLLAGALYLAANAFGVAIRHSGAEINAALIFNLGELLFVASGLALWSYYGRERIPLRVRTLPLIATLAFSLLFLAQPAMTGIISIWSTGLTLYLPWPAYALSLYAIVTAIVVQLRARRIEALGILLLLSAGFAPQLSHQFLMGLIGLIVICRPEAGSTARRHAPSPPAAGLRRSGLRPATPE